MLNSLKTSHLFLRLGLALVFLWFGIDKFVHPDYWINAWMPLWLQNILSRYNIGNLNFIYTNGIFEVVLGLGFVFNILVKLFALLAVLFLLVVILSFGLNEITVRDAGLIAAALALLFWNGRKSRTF
ncbi:MAG: DoxX family membrane protein [Parcubacteria group bacterium]|nr:DoxX family membrane protein [Parcubacteria group bacterium]